MPASNPENIWKFVEPTGFCWLWSGSTTTNIKYTGYGRLGFQRKIHFAHRRVYELLVGPIPEGHELDHLCKITCCVNPDHLEPVIPRENKLRSFGITGAFARRTHCKWGHEYTPDNTHIRKGGGRVCRKCDTAEGRRLRGAK